MKTFNDTEGRDWTVLIAVGAVKRVRAALDIDLYALIDDQAKALAELMDDPCRLVDVVYVLCRDQAEQKEVLEVQFGEALAGDTLEALAEAFVEALIDFFPKARSREALRKIVRAGKQVSELMQTRAEKELETIDVEKVAEKLIDDIKAKAEAKAAADKLIATFGK
jgi:hypothetical protein